MKARPLLVASAGLAVISMGVTEAFAAGNLMPAPQCPPGEIEHDGQCIAARLDPGDGGTPAPDAGTRKPQPKPKKR